ncbi:hypothetical protein BT93_C0264 [Corymbia citriodora subsp. variegata]|nr:hypothetical protein BT93_C0264 [Corymbia citriodora subsp. variegata]
MLENRGMSLCLNVPKSYRNQFERWGPLREGTDVCLAVSGSFSQRRHVYSGSIFLLNRFSLVGRAF